MRLFLAISFFLLSPLSLIGINDLELVVPEGRIGMFNTLPTNEIFEFASSESGPWGRRQKINAKSGRILEHASFVRVLGDVRVYRLSSKKKYALMIDASGEKVIKLVMR